MIQEAYCSYEVSKLLKEKGFECEKKSISAMYNELGVFHSLSTANDEYYDYKDFDKHDYIAPTQQMAMAWLSEVYNIYIEIYVIKNYDKKICEYTYTIMDLNFPGSDDGIDYYNKYKTHKQACEVAIKYCLEHLI